MATNPPAQIRSPFTSSGLNALLKDASGIRRMGDGAEEAAEKLGTLLMAKAADQSGDKAREARRTTLFKEDIEAGFNDVLKGAVAEPTEPTKPTAETLFASLQSMETPEIVIFTRLLANWVIKIKAEKAEKAKAMAQS